MLRTLMQAIVNLLRNNIEDPTGQRGVFWIYPDAPRVNAQPPWISVYPLGMKETTKTIAKSLFELQYAILILVDVKQDPCIINEEKYSGGKLLDYLGDKVLETFRNNRQFAENVQYTTFGNCYNVYDELEHGLLKKVIEVEVRYWG